MEILNVQKSADQILKDFGFENASDEQKTRVLAALEERINDIVIFTLVKNLSAEQSKEFLKALDDENSDPEQKNKQLEEKIETMAAQVPGLAQQIEQALAQEYELLRSVLSNKN